MERGTRAVEAVIGIAVCGTLASVAIGGNIAASSVPNARPWFLAASLWFALAIVVFVFYFGIHPLLVHLDAWRIDKLSVLRSTRAAAALRSQSARAANLAAALLPGPSTASAPTASATTTGGPLSIISAIYGAGDTWVNVKHYIDPCVSDAGWVTINVDNDTFGGDPIVNWPKRLKVTYRVGSGGEMTIEIPEGGQLSIP